MEEDRFINFLKYQAEMEQLKNMRTFKLFIKRLINYIPPPTYKNVRKDDVFLVSYPKSGNTWLRFILANLLSSEKADFNNFNDFVPDVYKTPSSILDKFKSPRIIKSHHAHTRLFSRVIYIYRDPRDVVISYYFHQKKFEKDFDNSVESFIRDFIEGTNSSFGPWDWHLKSWMNSPLVKTNNIFCLRYEDLKSDSFSLVKKITEFLSLNLDDKAIERAIENSKFESMQKIEKEQAETATYLKSFNSDISFVRSGKSEWEGYFNPELKELFKSKFGKLLIDLRYEKDYDW